MLSATITHSAEEPTWNYLVRIQKQDNCKCWYLEFFPLKKKEKKKGVLNQKPRDLFWYQQRLSEFVPPGWIWHKNLFIYFI